MKKVLLWEGIALLLLAGVLCILLQTETVRDRELSVFEEEITAHIPLDGMEKAGEMRFKRSFSLNAPDYREFFYYIPDNTMSVQEICMVKLADPAQGETVVRAFEARIAEQKNNFDGYGTNQTDLLNQAIILSNDRYVCLFIGEDAATCRSLVRKKWEE